jgi:hypothetical protein
MKLVDVALLIALFTLLSFLWGVGDGTIQISPTVKNIIGGKK